MTHVAVDGRRLSRSIPPSRSPYSRSVRPLRRRRPPCMTRHKRSGRGASNAAAALATVVSTRSSASTSSSRVGNGGGVPGGVLLVAPAAGAVVAVVDAVGVDAEDDELDVDDASVGCGGELNGVTAPRGAFSVDRMSSRMVMRRGDGGDGRRAEEQGGHAPWRQRQVRGGGGIAGVQRKRTPKRNTRGEKWRWQRRPRPGG